MDVTSRSEIVTPELAKDWIATSMYNRQRPLRQHHVIALGCAMLDGTFTPHKPLVFAFLGGQRYCVDGQHTLHAIVESKVCVELMITEHEVQTEEEIADLYGRLDRGIPRTFRDALVAQDLAIEAGITLSDLTCVNAAVALMAADFNSKSRSVDERNRLIREWASEARTYFELVRESPREVRAVFRRATVIGMALVTIRNQPEKASEFWSALAMDSGLERDDPRKTLLRWLTTKGPGKPEMDARLIALAWNAHYRGDRLQVLRPTRAMPLRLLGTQLDVPPMWRRASRASGLSGRVPVSGDEHSRPVAAIPESGLPRGVR